MGFRQGVLLATTCFLFGESDRRQRVDYRTPLILLRLVGVLLACFAVDYRVLFEPLTEEIVQDGFQYYRTFFNAPLGIKVRRCCFVAGRRSQARPKKPPADFSKINWVMWVYARCVDRRCFTDSLPWE
jgi:hypothetical protein